MSDFFYNPNELWVCEECGSEKVEEKTWRNINTGHMEGTSECWCEECCGFCNAIELKEWKKKNE